MCCAFWRGSNGLATQPLLFPLHVAPIAPVQISQVIRVSQYSSDYYTILSKRCEFFKSVMTTAPRLLQTLFSPPQANTCCDDPAVLKSRLSSTATTHMQGKPHVEVLRLLHKRGSPGSSANIGCQFGETGRRARLRGKKMSLVTLRLCLYCRSSYLSIYYVSQRPRR